MASRTTPPKDHVFGFEMLDTGKCVLTLADGEQVTFRRPKFGEFRAMREALNERDKDALRLSEKYAADAPTIPGKDDAPRDVRLEAALAARDGQYGLEDELTARNLEWVASALAPLVESGDFPDPDEWPLEMGTNQFIIDLVGHWRHVPLGRGGRAT